MRKRYSTNELHLETKIGRLQIQVTCGILSLIRKNLTDMQTVAEYSYQTQHFLGTLRLKLKKELYSFLNQPSRNQEKLIKLTMVINRNTQIAE